MWTVLWIFIQKEMDSISKIYQLMNYDQHRIRQQVFHEEIFQIKLITNIRLIITFLSQFFMWIFLFIKTDSGDNACSSVMNFAALTIMLDFDEIVMNMNMV